ncbi:hypothetical protein GCM10022409_16520 [Hymenobacter glaciei]|uniref:DUF72 domain-containing protein n=1 Tax=Hymenobacter glaciei TaxID=877209 RepID=A0ABP7TXX3_9BACT
MTDFHVGCSGYHYRHWRGRFYPEKRPMWLWFEYYSQHFRTLELNVTFYRFPQLSFLENWYRLSPPVVQPECASRAMMKRKYASLR